MKLTLLTFLLIGPLVLPAALSADNVLAILSSTPQTQLFASALQLTGLTSTFSDSNLTVTVFAPSNDAFTKALGMLGLSMDTLQIYAPRVAPILLYQGIRPAVQSSDLVSGGAKTWYYGAFAPYLRAPLGVSPTNASVRVETLGTDATVVAANIPAGSSIVHVTDSILLPFFPSAASVIVRYTEITGLGTLSGLARTLAPAVLDMLGPLGEYTVFAPSNAAFTTAMSNGSQFLQQLRSSAGGVSLLLSYHIVPLPVMFDVSGLSRPTIVTTLAGLKLTVIPAGNSTLILFPGGNATVTPRNFSVGFNAATEGSFRGIVYVIDQVLVPPLLNTVADALAQKTDTTTFTAALNATNSSGSSSNGSSSSNSGSTFYAGLLGSSTFKGTLLVPTDAAFVALFASKGWTAAALLASSADRKKLLDLHVIPNVTLSLSSLAINATRQLTPYSGSNTSLTVRRNDDGTVVFTATSNSNSSATALGYQFYSGAAVGNTTTLIFINAVLVPADLSLGDGGRGGAVALGGPSPLTVLLYSLLAAAALQIFARY